MQRTASEIARFSKADAKVYPEFDTKLNAVANTFRRLLWLTPPTISPLSLRSLSDLLALARELRLSGDIIYDLIDIMTMSVKDYVDDWFECDQIKAILTPDQQTKFAALQAEMKEHREKHEQEAAPAAPSATP